MKTSLYQDQSGLIGHDIIEIWVRLSMTNLKEWWKYTVDIKFINHRKKKGKKTWKKNPKKTQQKNI